MLMQSIEVIPAAPYVELTSTATVSAGDIKRFLYGDQWESAGRHELGKSVGEITDWVFARVLVPAEYRLCGPHEHIDNDSLCWWSETEQWAKPADVWPGIGNGALIADLLVAAKKNGTKAYFATAVEPDIADVGVAQPKAVVPEASEAVEVPVASTPVVSKGIEIEILEGHRWMDAGEHVRVGDRYRMVDGDQWMTADANQAGFAVPDKAEDNGFISYCRPINPGHRFWFISVEGSDENGRGTEMEPWNTKEHAITRINKGAKQLGTPMFGTILNESGAGVHHFDMDAPDLITPGTAAPKKLQAAHRKLGTEGSEAGKVYLCGKKRIRPKHWSRQNISRFMKRLNARCPSYRAMFLGDQLKGTDMVCVREEGRWKWRSVGSSFQSGIGMPVEECPWIAARAHPPEEGMSNAARGASLIEYHLGEIYEILASLKE